MIKWQQKRRCLQRRSQISQPAGWWLVVDHACSRIQPTHLLLYWRALEAASAVAAGSSLRIACAARKAGACVLMLPVSRHGSMGQILQHRHKQRQQHV